MATKSELIFQRKNVNMLENKLTDSILHCTREKLENCRKFTEKFENYPNAISR